MLLRTDEIIYNILKTAKDDGAKILEPYIIRYPSDVVMKESNAIYVATVDSESVTEGYDFSQYNDLVEILIVTKQRDYQKAIRVIKGTSRYIVGLIKQNKDKFPNSPVIRNITPEYNRNFVLTRGHIMVQVRTNPIDDNVSEDEQLAICEILLEDIEYE